MCTHAVDKDTTWIGSSRKIEDAILVAVVKQNSVLTNKADNYRK